MALERLERLTVHVCGNSGPLDEFNPSFVARQKFGLELLYVLNMRPMTVKQVYSILGISRKYAVKLLDDWVRINAVREESGVYYVNFAVFTKEDLSILAKVSKPIANALAEHIGKHVEEITSLAKDFSAAQQVQTEKLLFAALGCFIFGLVRLKNS